jgi:hypothetical protein
MYVTTDGQAASLSWNKAPIWVLRPDFYYCQTVAVYWCGTLCLTRGQVCRLKLLLALARAVILGSESRGMRDHILLSDSRLLQPGGPGLSIYIPQEQGDPVKPPGTGVPFRRLPLLAGLRCRYSNPPPRGVNQFPFPYYVIFSRRGPHTENTVLLFRWYTDRSGPVVPR